MEIQDFFKTCGLNPDELGEVEKSFVLKKYRPDEVVFNEGDTPQRFYLIRSGQALVTKRGPGGDDEPLNVLKPGHCFGEIGLLENINRTATIKAIGPLEIFRMEGDKFKELLKSNPCFSKLVRDISIKRLLKQIFIYRELDDNSLAAVQEIMVEKTYPAGMVIFRENEPPDALYIIMTGSVRVFRKTRYGKEVPVAMLSRWEFFGEQGLIDSEPRSASVAANEECKMLVMPRDAFQDLLKKNAVLSFSILKVLSQRMRETSKEVTLAKSISYFKGMTIIARPDRCMACKSCEIACAVAKSRTQQLYEAVLEEPVPVKRIRVRKSMEGSEPQVRPEHCVHCHDAPCLSSCKFNAIKRDLGTKTIDIIGEKCVGCGLCARACPFNVISMIRTEGKRRVALKCTYCSEHQEGPACVRSCPTNALVIGLAAQRDID